MEWVFGLLNFALLFAVLALQTGIIVWLVYLVIVGEETLSALVLAALWAAWLVWIPFRAIWSAIREPEP